MQTRGCSLRLTSVETGDRVGSREILAELLCSVTVVQGRIAFEAQHTEVTDQGEAPAVMVHVNPFLWFLVSKGRRLIYS